MATPAVEKIGIIGGGFSGVMTAVNLARLTQRHLELTIINHARPTGRGTAYGTHRSEHLLNVAARNMSAFPDLPDHFLQWLRTRSDFDTVSDVELRERFIPRRIYGDYLRSMLHQQLQSPIESVPVHSSFIDGQVVDLQSRQDKVFIQLADKSSYEVDRVVLATGNEPPAGLPGSESLGSHPAWVGNPWQAWENRLPSSNGTIVLLGTGLTTVDAVISLRALGWQGMVHAVSRNGWLPHSHFRGIDYPDFPPADVDLASLRLPQLLALIEKHCALLRDRGANPAIIVDKLRPHTQRIWQHFTLEERQEFARHHAARWNVMRHRIAPEIYAQLATAQLTGQLKLHAAGIERVEADGEKLRVHLSDGKPLTGDLVINATGPQTRFSKTASPLLTNLLASGQITADEMDMGIRVDADHTAIDRDGRRSKTILALGPLLKGTLWETIAVPELRGQARKVAETILNQSPPAQTADAPVMMEYMI